ncbi:MAG: DUF692 family protein [Anaerolineae bacterium]|nr:DUF692 family protein [Anaerolineae bacterium]
MQFAINYSPEAAALLAEGAITLDVFKCPDWPHLVAEARQQRPVYIHFPIVLGRQSVHTLDLVAIETWLAGTGTRYVNTHLEALAQFFPPPPSLTRLLEAVLPELERLVQVFGKERVLVENVPYLPPMVERGLLPLAVDPPTIRAVVEAADCGFLLDVSHAAICCEAFGTDFATYTAGLPVERLRELHITGLGYDPAGIRTDHLELLEPDWQRLDYVLAQIRAGAWGTPTVLAFEYGGIGEPFAWRSRREVIAAQVPRLYALAHGVPVA